MEQEIEEIKRIVENIKKLQKSINEQEIRLNNKLQKPRNLKERVARLFSCPEKEAEKILETMEKECEKLKKHKKELEESIQKARESIEKKCQNLSALDPSKCLQELGAKDYKLTDSLKDSCNDLGQNLNKVLQQAQSFEKIGGKVAAEWLGLATTVKAGYNKIASWHENNERKYAKRKIKEHKEKALQELDLHSMQKYLNRLDSYIEQKDELMDKKREEIQELTQSPQSKKLARYAFRACTLAALLLATLAYIKH